MKKVLGFVLVMLCAVSTTAYAGPEEGNYFSSGVTKDAPTASAYATVTADKKMLLDACERLQDSATKGHCVVVDAANLSVISKTTAATIGGGVANDTYLKRVIVLAALTASCVFTGFADSDGTAQSFTIPAAFVGERNFGGAKNSAGALTVTCSNAADDNLVLVEWWPAS